LGSFKVYCEEEEEEEEGRGPTKKLSPAVKASLLEKERAQYVDTSKAASLGKNSCLKMYQT
jgi:hypothetical protein